MVSHARQLCAAVGSEESTQKGKDNGTFSAKARKADAISVHVFEFKIRGEFAGGNKAGIHGLLDLHLLFCMGGHFYFITVDAFNFS